MEYLICRPDYYGIDYVINAHMDLNKQACTNKAMLQWTNLWEAIHLAGGTTTRVSPRPNLPDMVFTANAGLILDEKRVVISRFRHKERQGEEEFFAEFFADRGFEIIKTGEAFEGAGDALFFNGVLVGGHGFRTSPHIYGLFDHLNIDCIKVELVDPHFYHLDTCFCPLKDQDYLVNPSAFAPDSLSKIRALGGREIAVDPIEAKRFACNSVLVGDTVIIPSDCPNAVEKLQDFGYKVATVEMTEFLKSGGAAKCLTLRLD